MRLTLNRREVASLENGSHFFVAAVDVVTAVSNGMTLYYLDVDLTATPEELAVINKLDWGPRPLCRGSLRGVNSSINFDLRDILRTSEYAPITKFAFDALDNRENVEDQLSRRVDSISQELEGLERGLSDATVRLAERYQRAIQDVLGFEARIAEDGDVLFDHPEMGPMFIVLSADKDPEYMKMMLPAFFDSTRGVSRNDLVQICNQINSTGSLSTLIVHDDTEGNVSVRIGLVLAPPDTIPNEDLIRGVIGRSMSAVEAAAKLLFAELERLGIAPTP